MRLRFCQCGEILEQDDKHGLCWRCDALTERKEKDDPEDEDTD